MVKFEEKKLTAILTKEGKWYVSYNPDTGVASQGRTRGSALKNLKEAVELYLEDDDIALPEKKEIAEFSARVKVHA